MSDTEPEGQQEETTNANDPAYYTVGHRGFYTDAGVAQGVADASGEQVEPVMPASTEG